MSQSIYVFASSLCCCLVVCALLRLISPGGNTSKILSAVICVFMLCCIFSAVRTVLRNVNFLSNKENFSRSEKELSFNYDNRVIKETVNYLNQYINRLLESEGINNSVIRTIIETDEEKGIYVKEMNIYLDKKYADKKEYVNQLIFEHTGIKAEVTERNYE